MDKQNDQEFVKNFEEKVRADLIGFLQKKEALDEHVPECPDVEEKWGEIARSYMPDGVKEFQNSCTPGRWPRWGPRW